MYILDPIYHNSIGSAFAIRTEDGDTNCKIQMLIGDIAILMELHEIRVFIEVLKTAKGRCTCANCNCNLSSRTIKCDTTMAQVKFKLTTEELVLLEELASGVLFTLAVSYTHLTLPTILLV